MKYSESLKTAFFPYNFFRKTCEGFKIAFCVLFAMYVIAYAATVIAVRNIVSDIYDDAVRLVNETDNFYLSGTTFYYEGERYQGRVEKIDLTLIIDPDTNYTESDSQDQPLIFIFIGPDYATVKISESSMYFSYAELKASIGESIDFSKNLIIGELDYGRAIVLNVITSTLMLIFMLMMLAVLVLVLLIALLISIICSIFGIKSSFDRKLFIAAGSLIYPFLILFISAVIPNGLSVFISNPTLMLCIYVAVVLLYIIIALCPFKPTEQQSVQ